MYKVGKFRVLLPKKECDNNKKILSQLMLHLYIRHGLTPLVSSYNFSIRDWACFRNRVFTL